MEIWYACVSQCCPRACCRASEPSKAGTSNKQETDDAILALQSCAGEPARQLAAKPFFLAQAGPGSLAVISRIT